jgi:hypothetical protein
MNLVEFPLSVLSTRVNASLKTLEFADSIKGKNGEIISRSWIVTGADKWGLPTASDEEVLLGLIKLTVDRARLNYDEGSSSLTLNGGRKVYFTRYELLKNLRWSTEGRSYNRLQKALDRLSGVRIKASNAFFDNETKRYTTKNFGIIDSYEINYTKGGQGGLITRDEAQSNLSFFEWSEVLYKSFQVGFIKKLDLDFYLNLESAITKRLYRLLDKFFWYRSKFTMPIFALAHEKIGISRNYQYASSLRQQLEPSCRELVNLGYLSSYEFFGKGTDTQVSLVSAKGVNSIKEVKKSKIKNLEVPIDLERVEIKEATAIASADYLVVELSKRGVFSGQAKRLIQSLSVENLNKVRLLITHFDSLLHRKSKLVSKNPAGFLYRAVERIESFVLPEDNSTKKNTVLRNSEEASYREAEILDSQLQEARYLTYRRKEILKFRASLKESDLQAIYARVEQGISRLRSQISSERFSEALEHGVDEQLAKNANLLAYSEWLSANSPHGVFIA